MKYAVLVDAGYLFAEGSKMMFDEVVGIHIDLEKLTEVLKIQVENHYHEQGISPLRHIRTYWYDAKDRSDWVAQTPGYTLRLGRVNTKGQQKGVDGAIIRELLTLGNNRAVSDVFILSGDEDIIEGVNAVKDLGVYVGLIKVDDTLSNMSNKLMREADGILTLTKTLMEGSINVREMGEIKESSEYEDTFQFIYHKIFDKYTPEALLALKPQIPRELDKLILTEISQGNDLDTDTKHAIRAGFWGFVTKQANS